MVQINLADKRPVPAEELLRGDTQVARVHFQTREPVTYRFGGVEHACGYLYEATVVENLKGQVDRVSFVARDLAELDREYLVAVSEWSASFREEVKDIPDDATTPSDMAFTRCIYRHPRFAVDVIPFEQHPHPLGEEWLLVERARILPDEVLKKAVNNRVPWRDAREAILELIRQEAAQESHENETPTVYDAIKGTAFNPANTIPPSRYPSAPHWHLGLPNTPYFSVSRPRRRVRGRDGPSPVRPMANEARAAPRADPSVRC